MRASIVVALALLSAFGPTCFAATADDSNSNWPEFRGPSGDGHADAADLPTTWSEKENVRWKTPIHDRGWSSPVIWGKQIWLTTATEDGKEMYAVQIDRDTGKIERDMLIFSPAEPAFSHPYNSYASCTPAIEAGRVYIHFGSYGTTAIDTATGQRLWTRDDLPCDHFRGPGSSPILWGDLLLLTFDGYDFNYVCALNKHTGKTVWRTDRNIQYDNEDGDYHKAYVTPKVVTAGGRDYLVSPSAGATIAYDPATGKELWRIRSGGMNAAARPLFDHGLVFCTTAYQGFQLFAVRPEGAGDITESNTVWQFGKGVPSRSSPILVDGRIFMSGDQGVATCVEADTGKQVWQKRFKGNFTASPIYAKGRIFFFNEDGGSPVIEAGPTFNELAVNQLDDGCMASPAVSGNAMFLRTKTNLYRIEK